MVTRAWASGAVSGVVLVAGCTLVNPAYDDTGDPPGATAASVDGGGTDDATSQGTADPTTAPTGGATLADSGDPSTDTTSECIPHPDAHIEIVVATEDGTTIHPAICDDWISTGKGPLALVGDGLTYTACGGCECVGAVGLTLSFAGTLAPPVPPTCGSFVIWAGPARDGGCRWSGFAIFDEASADAPFFVGTNTRTLPASHFGDVAVTLGPDQACGDALGCTNTGPGRYSLVFADDTPVHVGAPDEVVIGFTAAQPYTVTNRMASVTLECDELVSWEALVAS